MSSQNPPIDSFDQFGLSAPLLSALEKTGYETPSPIQAQAIPVLLEGQDILGHAPTGTGKTAAFALPLLHRINLSDKHVQVLVLTPTRELAIQVSEAFQKYASFMKGFHVLPIYGGQDYTGQLRQLKRGVHIVVGTPGRVIDHIRRGTLKLGTLSAMVLDEADEMLRMGFIEDVEWVLEQAPENRQMALFSATMPREIERITKRFLNNPSEIFIKANSKSIENIRQKYWLVSGVHKLDALTRILEVESFDGVIIFVRTKTATTELAEKLTARGHLASAINGDMQQKQREQVIKKLKQGAIDILIATDVAARGLDVDRISHVINYDIPYDTEAYIHRIGRTGRAGRTGDAILFVSPREKRLFGAIEKATRNKITRLDLPSTEMVNNKRIANFKQQITDTIAAGELNFYEGLLEQYQLEHNIPPLEIAAALAKLTIKETSLLIEEKTVSEKRKKPKKDARDSAGRAKENRRDKKAQPNTAKKSQGKRMPTKPADGMERFRIEVGHSKGVEPRNIVGAIANEAGIESQYIGPIEINDDYSLIDLPVGMPREIFRDLKKAWVCGCKMNISRLQEKSKPKNK